MTVESLFDEVIIYFQLVILKAFKICAKSENHEKMNVLFLDFHVGFQV